MTKPTSDLPNHKGQIISSIVLIIVIPILIIANFFWQMFGLKKNLQAEIKNRADLVTNVLSADFKNQLESQDLTKNLQTKVETISLADKNIREINVLTSKNDGFEVIASSNEENFGLILASSENNDVWVTGTPISRELFSEGHFWQNMAVIKNASGKNTAILNLKLDLAESDAAFNQTFSRFLVILLIMLVLIIALLVNHLRFLRYVNLYDKLREVDEMKDEFISIASHELKTPMSTIKGYINMMLEGLTGKIDQVARDHVLKISANVDRLDTLVNELLDVSRLEQERMSFDLQQTSVKKVVENVLKEMEPFSLQKNIYLKEESFNQELPLVFVDPERLQQVLINLVSNGIKYTNEGGVSLVYAIEDDRLLVSVKDTGVGMSEKDMERLFEKFYRIKTEKTDEVPGTGLGLWLSKNIAAKMNCEIRVESKENKGSKFTVVIPIIKE